MFKNNEMIECLHLPLVYNQLWIFIYWSITWCFYELTLRRFWRNLKYVVNIMTNLSFYKKCINYWMITIVSLFFSVDFCFYCSALNSTNKFHSGFEISFCWHMELREYFKCKYVRMRYRYLAVSILRAYPRGVSRIL